MNIFDTLHPEGSLTDNLYPNIKKQNIPSKSISTDKLDDNVLSLIGSLKPSGTDTSTNILAYTSNKGIYVATDNGHWYYWNGSVYVDGGVYQAPEIADGSITRGKLDDDLKEKTDLVPQLNESITELKNATSIKVVSKNKYNSSKTESNKALSTDGSLFNEIGKYTSDFIEVSEGDIIKWSLNGEIAYTISATCGYDANKNFVIFKQYKMTTIPSDVTFIRFTTTTPPSSDLMVTINDEDMVYEPYFEPYYKNSLLPEIKEARRNYYGKDYDSLGARIDDIENVTISVVKSTNLFDKSKSIDNFALSSNGTLISEQGKTVTDFIQVENGIEVRCGYNGTSASVHSWCGYDKDKKFVLFKQWGVISVPENVRYIRLCFTTSQKEYLMVNKGTTRLPYEPYFEPYYKNSAKYENVVTVGDGRMFVSLRDAIESIKDASISKPYYIYIYEGTYNVMDYFTDEEINSASYDSTLDTFVGLELSDGMHLVGIGDADKIIIHGELATSYSESVRVAISTLNIKGNVSIENVTVTSSNIRYPIHDDFAINANCIHTLKNCKFVNKNPMSNLFVGYGLGAKSGNTINFYDCLIIGNLTYHNGGGFTKPSIVNMYNCAVTRNINLGDFYNENIISYLNLYNVAYGGITRYYEGIEHSDMLLVNEYIHGISPSEKVLLDLFRDKTLTFNDDGSITWSSN